MLKTVRAVALKDVPYSHDGGTTITIAKDAEFDCREDLIEGLEKEGFVQRAGSKAGAATNGKNGTNNRASELQRAAKEADELAAAAEQEARTAEEALKSADDAHRADAQAAFDQATATAKEFRAKADQAAAAAKKR